jgi:hypothetical protein
MFALLLATPLAALAQQTVGPQDRLRVDDVDPDWFETAAKLRLPGDEHEQQLIRRYPGQILRYGNLLALKLTNGKFVWLVDVRGDPTAGWFGCCEIFTLGDFWRDQEAYVVNAEFGEYHRSWLISERTAEVTVLDGTPHRDPLTLGLVVSVMASDMEGYRSEVWERYGDSWKRTYFCGELAYTTDFLRWEAPGRAVLGGPDHSGKIHEFILTKSDGTWHTDACDFNPSKGRP